MDMVMLTSTETAAILEMADTYGDTWDGAYLDVPINGTFETSVTLEDGLFTGTIPFVFPMVTPLRYLLYLDYMITKLLRFLILQETPFILTQTQMLDRSIPEMLFVHPQHLSFPEQTVMIQMLKRILVQLRFGMMILTKL